MSDLVEQWMQMSQEEQNEFIRAIFEDDPVGFYELMVAAHGEEAVLKSLDERPRVREYVLKRMKEGRIGNDKR